LDRDIYFWPYFLTQVYGALRRTLAFTLFASFTSSRASHFETDAESVAAIAMMRHPCDEHYRTLNLPAGASREDIQAAFREAALKFHPDVGEGGCAANFSRARVARDALLSSTRPGYGPNGASLRMYRYPGSQYRASDKWSLIASVLLPTACGMVVGFRLLYLDTGNDPLNGGVRAGGNSRVTNLNSPRAQTLPAPSAAPSPPPPTASPQASSDCAEQ
jgi:hypothetical protein